MDTKDFTSREEAQRIVALGYFPGRVTLRECNICGHIQWSCTETKEPDSIVILDLNSCPACNHVMMRAPEIAQWVFSVVLKAQLDAEKILKEQQ